jgi:hypothetical protein
MTGNEFNEDTSNPNTGFWKSITPETYLAFRILIILLLDGLIIATIMGVTYVLHLFADLLGLNNNNIVSLILSFSGSVYIVLYAVLAVVSVVGTFWKEIGWKIRELLK